MYYCSKNSRRKVVHTGECFHVQNVEVENITSFETQFEAYKSGYRLCRHCSPVARQYRKEAAAIEAFCGKHAIRVTLQERHIGVRTPYSKWRIVPDDCGQALVLYHKNSYKAKKETKSPISDHHLQNVSRVSVLDYLEYIINHEYYRMLHPVYATLPKVKKEPARKGTKRYKKQQKKAKRHQRYRSIQRVLNLIDRVCEPSSTPI